MPSSATLREVARTLLLIEMCSRVIRRKIRSRWRNMVSPSGSQAVRVAQRELGLFFAPSKGTVGRQGHFAESFADAPVGGDAGGAALPPADDATPRRMGDDMLWCISLKESIGTQFRCALDPNEQQYSWDPRTLLGAAGLQLMRHRVLVLVGLSDSSATARAAAFGAKLETEVSEKGEGGHGEAEAEVPAAAAAAAAAAVTADDDDDDYLRGDILQKLHEETDPLARRGGLMEVVPLVKRMRVDNIPVLNHDGQNNKMAFEAAKMVYARRLALRQRVLGDGHPLCADQMIEIAMLLCQRKDTSQQAESFLVDAHRIYKKHSGEDAPPTRQAAVKLAEHYADAGDYDRALELFTTLEKILSGYGLSTAALVEAGGVGTVVKRGPDWYEESGQREDGVGERMEN